MKTKFIILYLFLLTIISLNFFDAKFINPRIINYLEFITIMGTVIVSSYFMFERKGGFVLPVQIIYLSIFFSILMAYYSWGQGLRESFLEIPQFILWPLFFLLLHFKPPIKTLEKIVMVISVFYVILYFFQFANPTTVYFGKPISGGDEFSEQRGVVRIIFPGAGIFILSIFIAITKINQNVKNKWMYIGFAVMGLIVPVMQVTRQFIAGVFLIYFFHFFKGQSIPKKALLIISFILGTIIILSSDISTVRGVIEAQKRDSKLGSDYIRVQAGKYFLTDFSPNALSKVFGNGPPSWGISKYGKFEERLSRTHEYFLSDVGIIAVYAMFGIFAIIGFILIWYQSFVLPIPKQFVYAKYYLWYLLFTSFTWYSVYHYHYIIATIFALYIYHKSYMDQKKWTMIKNSLINTPELAQPENGLEIKKVNKR